MALMEPMKAEGDQGKYDSMYTQMSGSKGVEGLQRHINWSIGPVKVMMEPRLIYFGRGTREGEYHLLLRVLAKSKGLVDHGQMVRRNRWKQLTFTISSIGPSRMNGRGLNMVVARPHGRLRRMSHSK